MKQDKPTVRIKPSAYQPNKAELNELIRFPEGTTPEQLAKAIVSPVNVVYENKSK